MTKKSFFKRLYLVLGLSQFEPRVNCPYAPTPCSTAISQFLCIFFPKWPLIFCQHTIHQVIWPGPGSLDPSYAREDSWRRAFEPYAPLLFNLYHCLEQNLMKSRDNLSPDIGPGIRTQDSVVTSGKTTSALRFPQRKNLCRIPQSHGLLCLW